MLKNMSANVLGTMTNIPTTSSNVTAQAHFSTSAQHSQAQAHDYQRNASHAAALSLVRSIQLVKTHFETGLPTPRL
jgi:hypothetical protein